MPRPKEKNETEKGARDPWEKKNELGSQRLHLKEVCSSGCDTRQRWKDGNSVLGRASADAAASQRRKIERHQVEGWQIRAKGLRSRNSAKMGAMEI